MKKNQKGFSTIEGIVIVVVVSLLILVGWLVWNSAEETKPSSKNTNISSSANENVPTKQLTIEAPVGWNVYQDESLGIGFAYPATWTYEDKTEVQGFPASTYVGELRADDKATSIAITLVRKQDGRGRTRSSIEEWKTYAANANIQFKDLTELKSKYIAFSYTWVLDEGVTSLVYQVLEPDNNVQMLVDTVETNQKATIEQIVRTLSFEE